MNRWCSRPKRVYVRKRNRGEEEEKEGKEEEVERAVE